VVIVDDERAVEPRKGVTLYLPLEFEDSSWRWRLKHSPMSFPKHVECREERPRAVANVMGHGSATPALEEQSRLGAIHSLEL
jgi:hypothetical protein